MRVLHIGMVIFGAYWGTANAEVSIVPHPVELTRTRGGFTLTPHTNITVDSAFKDKMLGTMLAGYLSPSTGFPFSQVKTGGTIQIKKIRPTKLLGTEGYRLSVTRKQIIIESPTRAGAFYGLQTLRQLLPPEIFASSKQEGVLWTIPCMDIVDYPRFQWRGLLMDVSRHFMDLDYIKRFIDQLALHKLNTLHWHLCDNPAWRIEIKSYPKLTSEGSSKSRTINYGKPMFYTQEQIREVVQYAADRQINIVPEIEIPGHSGAAIRAYPEFGARDEQGKLGDVFNIRDETITALKTILDEVIELFPSSYIHCGGDEVWHTWVWEVDAESKAKAQRLGLEGAHNIQTWLMNEMGSYLESKGRRMVGWGEIAGEKLNTNIVVMAWRKGGETGVSSAKKRFDVVMAPEKYTYFDRRQARDEEGYTKAVLTTEEVYAFNPAFPHALTSAEAQHILGVQGQLWSEKIPTGKRMDYMAYPRACALAEIGWSPQERRSYKNFQKRLETHLYRLDQLKVNYRPVSVK